MSFELPYHTPNKAEQLKSESRFGNEQQIVETLREGVVTVLGPIDQQIPGVEPSTNEVDLVSVAATTNLVRLVNISKGKKNLLAVFKPFSGEDLEVKKRLQLTNLYSNEELAYLVSRFLGLKIVPPTVIRTISKNVEGSLQLFLPTDQWQSQKHAFEELSDEEFTQITHSDDWIAMALLDFLILNPDRHADNLFVEKSDGNTVPRLAAIDNGNSMSVYNYNSCKLHGPALSLTHVPGDPRERPRAVPIPAVFLDQIENALNDRMHFPIPLPPEITDETLAPLWLRAEALLQTGVILSRHNLHFVTGSTTLGGRHPEIRIM